MGYSDKLTFPASGKSLSAEDLSAEILKATAGGCPAANPGTDRRGGDHRAGGIRQPAMRCDRRGRPGWRDSSNRLFYRSPLRRPWRIGASPQATGPALDGFRSGGRDAWTSRSSPRSNGRLAVLEHQGNNRAGGQGYRPRHRGKVFACSLASTFNLPERQTDPAAYDRLLRALFAAGGACEDRDFQRIRTRRLIFLAWGKIRMANQSKHPLR